MVWVTNCSFLSNSATGGSSSFGGGIHNIGLVTVTNSLFAGNWATVTAAGGSAHGGGIGNSGGAGVTDSTFTSNSARGGFASYGGAIDSSDSLDVDSSYFNGNSATSPYPQTGADRQLWLWWRDQQLRHALGHQLDFRQQHGHRL